MIDCHAHVFSADAPAIAGARYRPAYAARLEDWKEAWREYEITHGVLVQPSFFGANNREMLEAIATDPRHLRGVAVVDAGINDSQLDHLDAGGVCAIRWNLKGVPDYRAYASAAWRGVLARIHERGWHLEIYVDHGRLAAIEPALVGSPVAVVFDHFGNPGVEEASVRVTFSAVERLLDQREVWVKLSAPYRLGAIDDAEWFADRWLEIAGPTRLVWGSDWPYTAFEANASYGLMLRALDRWIEPDVRDAVLWDNAARLYRFKRSD